MRSSRAEPAGRRTEAWLPRRAKQGLLSYDLKGWGVEPGREGNAALCDEAALGVWSILDSRLSEELRRRLVDRGTGLLVFRIGVRGRGWGPSLLEEMSGTLERATNYLAAHTGPGAGAKVRQQFVIVSCCLAPDRTVAEQILARLDALDDNKEGIYHVISLTDESMPRKSPKDNAPSPPGEQVPAPADAGSVHQHFHNTLSEFTQEARTVLRRLEPHLRTLLVTNPPASYEGKQILVEGLNKLFHAADMSLKHPQRDEPVTLLAIRGGARNKRGYLQLRPTKGGELLDLPDVEPKLIGFRRYRGLPADRSSSLG